MIIEHNEMVFDYWPSTGLFINKDTGKRGRGVYSLLKLLKEQQ